AQDAAQDIASLHPGIYDHSSGCGRIGEVFDRWCVCKWVERRVSWQWRQLSAKVLAERSGVLSLAEGLKLAAARFDSAQRTA
ncbi:MAG: hypothetical protein H7842_15465, partial [Gammaproteobacteria bacterium SHHR-1]